MDDNTSITENTLRLTTILEQKLIQEKALRIKQTMITQYFRPKDMQTTLRQSRCNVLCFFPVDLATQNSIK